MSGAGPARRLAEWVNRQRGAKAEGPGGPTVRQSLLALVVVCVAPGALGVLLLIIQAYVDGRQALMERARETARGALAEVDAEVRGAMVALQMLSASPALAAGDLRAFREQAVQALPHQAGANFVLSDAAGQQLLNTLVPEGQPLPVHGQPALQRRALSAGRAVVSDAFVGGVTRRLVVAVEAPVQAGSGVAATLAVGFAPERFTALLAPSGSTADWVVALFDRQGVIIARAPHGERYVGQQGAPALVRAMASADEGQVQTDTLEGTPVLAAFVRSPVTGWAVAAGAPRESLLASLRVRVATLVAMTLTVLGIAAWIGAWLSGRLAASMEALVAPAMALGQGRAVELPRLLLREADIVGRALTRASELFRARSVELDDAERATAAVGAQLRQMTHAALHDTLTELPNRAGVLQALHEHIGQWQRDGRPFALCFVDLDDFKPVNDRYGHTVGDELLCHVARRLRGAVRGSDSIGRLGGDEFAVLIDGVTAQEVAPIAEMLTQRLSSPFHVGRLSLTVTACVGVACCPRDGTNPLALLQVADAAMYRAKASGKGGFRVSGFGQG